MRQRAEMMMPHTTIPQSWSEDRYDLVWVLDHDAAIGTCPP